jgi:hypothetical protein
MLKKDITKFTYRPKDLRRNVKPDDFWKFSLPPDEVENITNNIANKFFENNQKPEVLNIRTIGKNRIFTTGSLYDALTIRRTNEILKKTFYFQISPRDQEVKQLWNIIGAEKQNSYVFRTDIKSFFEKSPFKNIINDLYKDNLITKTIYNHLTNIYIETSKDDFEGLPRGLAISSSLSEYALLAFDYKARNIDECFYYSRYVDDIILVTTKEIKDIEKVIEEELPYDLILNDKKTFYKKIGSDNHIDFLGYSFNLKNVEKTSISQRKIDKIKTRIALSLRSYVNVDKNFELLLDRLRFLSGNSILKMAGRKKPITVGIRYQYQLCSEKSMIKQLKELDTFYKGILNSGKYIGAKLKLNTSRDQMQELSKISFLSGYQNKITHTYGRRRVSILKDAWRYE